MASGSCIKREPARTGTVGRAGFSDCPARIRRVTAHESSPSASTVSCGSRGTFKCSVRWWPISPAPRCSEFGVPVDVKMFSYRPHSPRPGLALFGTMTPVLPDFDALDSLSRAQGVAEDSGSHDDGTISIRRGQGCLGGGDR